MLLFIDRDGHWVSAAVAILLKAIPGGDGDGGRNVERIQVAEWKTI